MIQTAGWFYLAATGLLDVAWALTVKKAEGFTHPYWTAASMLVLMGFVYAVAKALQLVPMGTAYVVWTGIGAAGTVIAGIVFFAEPATAVRLFFIAVIVTGIVGLKVSSG